MPLSRHFYSLDEVQAAIVYTGSRGIPQETVFWCREAIESGCVAEAIAGLFESWLWYRGPLAMSWLVEAQRRLGGSEVTAEDVEEMACRLSQCRIKDHSLWWLFVREGEPADRVTPRSPRAFPSEEEREVFFVRALYQGKARSAWWAGRAFTVERWWWLMDWYIAHVVPEGDRSVLQRDVGALRGYDGLLGYVSEVYDRAVRGAILLRVCILRSPSVLKEREPATQILSVPEPRTLPIPTFGLYGSCHRGWMRQKESTMGDLWDVFQGMTGCPYWEEVREEIREEVGTATATVTVADKYFPHDLPDEWPVTEKEKSHGAGILREGEHVTLWGYTRRYMMGMARLVWHAGSMSALQERLESVQWSEGVSPFVTLVQRGEESADALCSLSPVHKKRVIV